MNLEQIKIKRQEKKKSMKRKGRKGEDAKNAKKKLLCDLCVLFLCVLCVESFSAPAGEIRPSEMIDQQACCPAAGNDY